uniref:Uncharacterized protein n=1 Tax=Romanomermis culicivorax TaxID=13658 RepID=A0A915L2A4_ROMCU
MPGHPNHGVATFLGPVAMLAAVRDSRKSTLPRGKGKTKKERKREKERKKKGKREERKRNRVSRCRPIVFMEQPKYTPLGPYAASKETVILGMLK